MPNLTKHDPAGTSNPHPLAVRAYRGPVTIAGVSLQEIDEALRDQRDRLIALKSRDRRFISSDRREVIMAAGNDPHAKEAVGHLANIGLEMRPDFSSDQAQHWAAGIIGALSNYPGPVLVSACQSARHTSFRYWPDIKPAIQRAADEIMSRHKVARFRLESLRREILSAAQPRLPQPPPRPLTQEEVDLMSPEYRSLGLKVGALIRDADGRVIPNPEPEINQDETASGEQP